MALALVRLASKIDGRRHIALRIDTTPDIGEHNIDSCVAAGIRHMKLMLIEETKLEVNENVMKKHCGELFNKEK